MFVRNARPCWVCDVCATFRQQLVNEKVRPHPSDPVDEALGSVAPYSGFEGRFAHKIWGLQAELAV